MGESSPSGSISSIWALGRLTNETHTPCSGKARLGVMSLTPKTSRYSFHESSIEGVATPTWLSFPIMAWVPACRDALHPQHRGFHDRPAFPDAKGGLLEGRREHGFDRAVVLALVGREPGQGVLRLAFQVVNRLAE